MFSLSLAILQTTNSWPARGGAVPRAGALSRENLPVRGKQEGFQQDSSPHQLKNPGAHCNCSNFDRCQGRSDFTCYCPSEAHGNGVTPLSWLQSLVTSHPLGRGEARILQAQGLLEGLVCARCGQTIPGVSSTWRGTMSR